MKIRGMTLIICLEIYASVLFKGQRVFVFLFTLTVVLFRHQHSAAIIYYPCRDVAASDHFFIRICKLQGGDLTDIDIIEHIPVESLSLIPMSPHVDIVV